MSKKHYVVYFQNENTITKTSKEWAKDNQECFPNYANKVPTSNEIDRYLVDNFGFTLTSDDEKFVCFNLVNSQKFNSNKFLNKKVEIIYNENLDVIFSIGETIYALNANPAVSLMVNQNHIESGYIKDNLRQIVEQLSLNNDFLYNANGKKETTNSLASKIYNYLVNVCI
jgi:hypothetical protein